MSALYLSRGTLARWVCVRVDRLHGNSLNEAVHVCVLLRELPEDEMCFCPCQQRIRLVSQWGPFCRYSIGH